jgi:hypothetical protein
MVIVLVHSVSNKIRKEAHVKTSTSGMCVAQSLAVPLAWICTNNGLNSALQ